jgi:ABC-type glycerol-3-phosphate transport system substrate-binding protein
MKHRLHILLLVVLLLAMFAGVSPSTAQDASLTIWTDDQRLPVVTELSKQFTDEYGIEVIVEPMGIQDTKDAMIRGASTGPVHHPA